MAQDHDHISVLVGDWMPFKQHEAYTEGYFEPGSVADFTSWWPCSGFGLNCNQFVQLELDDKTTVVLTKRNVLGSIHVLIPTEIYPEKKVVRWRIATI